MRVRHTAVRLATVVLLLGVVNSAAAATPPTADGNGGAAAGEDAIALLGDHLPAIAAEHGLTAAQLRAEFLSDGSLRAEADGALLYVEPPAAAAPTHDPATASDIPLEDTFLLHSKPGAPRVIYLDFDGHPLDGAWESGETFKSVPDDHVAHAYDTDGDPGSFSSSELATVQGAWRRMAEDFAPFDVDVTTEDPGQAAITRTDASDQAYGTRVAFTTDRVMQEACGCGGVAYVDVFDRYGVVSPHDRYQPAWVFTTGAQNAAEAGSHEAGHTLGLRHDGTSTTGYYRGHGDWAPIMGVGYYEAITQWSKGEYDDADNREDDFVVMRGNGAPWVADDHGGTGSPTSLGGTNLTAAGTIGSDADQDAFSVGIAAPSTLAVQVLPAVEGANLDIALTLLDAAGQTIAAADPPSSSTVSGYLEIATGLDAGLQVALLPGTYTLVVEGVGKGDPVTDGYSGYGSVGRYSLSGSVTADDGATTNTPPTATLTATPQSVETGSSVVFGVTASDADGDTLAWTLAFGDGGSAGGSAESGTASHTYTAAGLYTATLSVSDGVAVATDSVTITVTAPTVAVPVAPTLTVDDASDTLTWAPVDGATSYDLLRERQHKSGRWTATTLLSGVISPYDAGSIEAGTYRYLARAVNQAGTSDWSDPVTVTVEGSGDGGSTGGNKGGGKGGGPKKSARSLSYR